MKLRFLIVVSLLLVNTTACNASWLVFHKPEFKGKIVDIDTNEPIEGAVVVAIYRKLAVAPGDTVDVDIDAREALTNKSGEFTIPSYTTLINPLSWSNPVDFIIFKPGYLCDGVLNLEEVFSGSGQRDMDIKSHWNNELHYRVLKKGVIMLPKVAGKDRIESSRNTSRMSQFRGVLPKTFMMELIENKYILELEQSWRK